MLAKEVFRILKISRPTLTKYVKSGIIRIEILPNGRYNYNEDDVYKFLNRDLKRKTVVYARVSTPKQKSDLENQIEILKQFCFSNGFQIAEIYSDVASGISFEKRNEFFKLLDNVIQGRIERVVITYKDRLSRVGFDLFQRLFEQFNCKIVVMSEVGNAKLDSEEIFEEIVSLLHCYSMKLYSNRRKMNKLREVIQDVEDEDPLEEKKARSFAKALINQRKSRVRTIISPVWSNTLSRRRTPRMKCSRSPVTCRKTFTIKGITCFGNSFLRMRNSRVMNNLTKF